MEDLLILGVDIGGSHITSGLIDLEKRMVVSTSIRHKLVDPLASADSILSSWCDVIKDAYSGYHCKKSIVLAMPGPFDYENGICLLKDGEKFSSLYLMDVRKELAIRLEIMPEDIKIINDAEAFLKGEIFVEFPAHDSILGLTLGTGLGSALYLNGDAKDADLWCRPFLDGIAEDYLATGWFVKRYFQLTGIEISGVKELSKCISNDLNAKKVFAEFGVNLACFLKPIVTEYNLEMVIIGGNISHAFDHFSKELYLEMALWQKPVVISVSKLKEHAALLGAAAEKFDTKSNAH